MIGYADAETFDAMISGVPTEQDHRALLGQFNNTSSMFIGSALDLYNQAKEAVINYDFDNIRRKLAAAYRHTKNIGQHDIIVSLKTIDQFQSAKAQMRRWVMANPYLFDEFKEGRHYGYQNNLTHTDKHLPGHLRTDYKIVTDSLAVVTEQTTVYPTYLELTERLSMQEKLDIDLAWLHATYLYKLGGDDPFSPYNASL